jgi:hypothetical protein
VAIARALGFRDARLQQSIVICKHAGFGCRGPPHHHSTFLYSAPPSVVGFWNALEDGQAGFVRNGRGGSINYNGNDNNGDGVGEDKRQRRHQGS